MNQAEFKLVQTMHHCRCALDHIEKLKQLMNELEYASDHGHDYDLDWHLNKLEKLLSERLEHVEGSLNLKRFNENNPHNRKAFAI